jgi:hypothetical protein
MKMTRAIAVSSQEGRTSVPRLKVLFLLGATLLLTAYPAFATTNTQVGGCKPASIPNFPTIQMAVNAVGAGFGVFVCPGTYAEQVTIKKSLTLSGVNNGATSVSEIVVPTSGLTPTTDSFGNTIAALVVVMAGTVRIENITVDATGNTVGAEGGGINLVGIFFASGTSGVVEDCTVRNIKTPLEGGNLGTGIWAENGGGTTETVDILDSSIHSFDNAGIFTESTQTSNFTSVHHNTITDGNVGIAWRGGISDEIMYNVISTTGNGIDMNTLAGTPSLVTVSNNSVTSGSFVGISVYAFDNVTILTAVSNRISGSPEGIQVGLAGASLKDNIIMQTGTGIDLNCTDSTLHDDLIVESSIGVVRPPSGFGLNSIGFYSVVTDVKNVCP